MREIFCLLIFVLTVTNLVADSVSYNDCGSVYSLLDVDVQGCILSPCHFNIGQWYNVTTRFYTDRPSFQLDSEVIARIFNVDNTVVTTPSDPCIGLSTGTCPVEAQHTYEYRAELYVDSGLLPARAIMEWKLLNENMESVICFAFSARLYEIETPTPTIKRYQRSTSLRNFRQRKHSRFNKKH